MKIDSSTALARARAANKEKSEARHRATVQVTKNWRVAPYDDRNWCLERKHGETWTVTNYWSSLEEALVGTSKLLLEVGLRSSIDNASLLSAIEQIRAAQTAVLEEIRNV